jgi:carbamoyl-phosphate synthase large subunit
MITGVGALIGQGIIKSLRKENLGFRLVGIDANPYSVGFQWTDISHTVVRTTEPSWLTSIIDICNKEKVVLIVPSIEQDIKALLQHKKELSDNTEALPLLNSPDALRVGFDKWELHRFAKQHDIRMPMTWHAGDTNISLIPDTAYPLLLKPRSGTASKGIYRIENKNDMECLVRVIEINEYIIQQHIGSEDEEYTVGIFGFHDGTLSESFALKRKLKFGTTFEAETIYDPKLSETSTHIAIKLNIVGPTNLQFRKAGDDYFLFEVNPRFSSSSSIRSAFGFNEPVMAVKSFIFKQNAIKLTLKKGRCSRYICDNIVYSD